MPNATSDFASSWCVEAAVGYAEHDMNAITCIEDLRVLARKRVPRMFYDYVDGGSWTESTYRANERDFQRILLRQRVAVNLAQSQHPHHHAGPGGRDAGRHRPDRPDRHAARGRRNSGGACGKAFGMPFTLSTVSICSIEDVAEPPAATRSGSSSASCAIAGSSSA